MARLIFTAVLAAMGGTIACTTVESPTDLVEEGPPMIRQVFMYEEVEDPPGGGVFSQRQALSFGTHPNALSMKHRVLSAAPHYGTQRMRIVMDELLVGNYLEEILCRSPVDEDAWATVPLGTTPDDIADCAVQPDVLPLTCTGDHAVCLDAATGAPVGVADQNGDGAADDTQFIPGAVSIQCGSISVPLDLQATYWQPSGNQQVPAAGGLNALGPAIVIKTVDGLPVSQTCQIVFGEAVVDKAGIRPCAPQFGDAGAPDEVAWPPPNPCPEADTSATQFTVGPMLLVGTNPPEGETWDRLDDLTMSFNAKIEPASLSTLMITPAPAGAITATVDTQNPENVLIHIEGGLAAGTDYTLTVTPTDVFDSPAEAPFVLHFTTI